MQVFKYSGLVNGKHRSRHFILCFSFIYFFLSPNKAQSDLESQAPKKSISIAKTDLTISIDGKTDELIWQRMPDASDFWQYFPFDTAKALTKTEVWMTFDEEYLYVAAKLYDTIEGNYVTESLKRDFVSDNVDVFKIWVDPFNDGTNGLLFGINPYGALLEASLFNGGSTIDDFDMSWDNKWFGESFIGQGYWSIEMAIPFKTLRFKTALNTWGVNFYRVDSKANERSIWSRVPRQFLTINLAYCGDLIFTENPPEPGANIAIIPHIAGDISNNKLINESSRKNLEFGGDVKFSITPSLNLDMTFNPDFSQVEVDVQRANIDRFELFFPEKRQFFIENADLFSSFGSQNARPFFSRRIGLAIDTATGQNVQNRIIAGARLSGRINRNWRIGLLDIQTEQEKNLSIPASNFATIAIQRNVFSRSNLGAIFINKQNLQDAPVDPLKPEFGNYNRLFGIDFNLASSDGKWIGKTYYHRTFSDNNPSQSYSHLAELNFSTLKFNASWAHQIIGDGFNAKVGYVPRTGFNRVNPALGFNIYRNSKLINRYRINISNNTNWDETWGVTDNNFSAAFSVDFQSSATFSFSLLSNYVKLFFPFNPTGNMDKLFMPGEHFLQNGFSTTFTSNSRNPFYLQASVISGIFYNGSLRQVSGSFNYRYQQYASLALNYSVSYMNLSSGYGKTTLLLVGPRIDLTLTNKLYWTTFLQYNNQIDNININSRIQWRFRPVSDLFVVYTDNYFPQDLTNKSRAFVIKLTYWLNI